MSHLPTPRVKGQRLEPLFFTVLAIVGFAVVVYVFFPWHRSSADVPLPKTVSVPAKNLPPVEVPADFARNTMAIPGQQATAPIDAETVVGDELSIPGDVKRVGYYTGGGALDGKVGELLIAGHVNYSGQGTGVLGRIGFLHVGDAIITRGQGGPQAWRITGLTSYLKAEGLPSTIFRATGARGLALVTCGGTLDRQAHSYLSNIVVTAAPVKVILRG
ncbi:MAG: hypothetical protein QOH56_1432 [Pseudonocardiales bacterium]|jgi:hypothetical protein|nr:hypothetical protein [Frankiales bacterium]MDQ1735181.1 hypothetical protein [Pseudonocardiales bacterium]